MNLLFIIPYSPTPIRARSFYLLQTLLQRGHSITLATLWEKEIELQNLADWRAKGITVLAAKLPRHRALLNMPGALFANKPMQSRYCWQPVLAQKIITYLKKFNQPGFEGEKPNVIHIEHLRGSQYGLILKNQMTNNQLVKIPLVWDSVDCISLLFEKAAQSSGSQLGRWMARLELSRTRRYESFLLHQFKRTFVTSEIDRQAMIKLVDVYSKGCEFFNEQSICVIPNGVDLNYFKPSQAVRKPATVVLTGKMSYHANVTAAIHLVKDIMPNVWARRSDVKVEIVGSAPTSQVSALAAQNPGRVIVTGFVADLRPYLWEATLAVAPVPYGAGIQNKVLEAMACATAVVSSPQAITALRVSPGADLLVAGSPDEFAGMILDLLEDDQKRHQIGWAGRIFVEQNHDWDGIAEKLEGFYQNFT